MNMAKKSSYNAKKTAEKAAWGLGYVLVSGALVVWQDDVRFMALIPALMALQNYIKHRKD